MEQLHANIQQLENKLLQLKEKYEQQKITIQKLQQENEKFRNTLLLQKERQPLGNEKQNINTILQQLTYQKDKDIKKTLGRYIQYLDQCITLLETSN